jgi:hypothetical protein
VLLTCCSTDLLALPTCDPDKSFAVQIGHEETMVNGPVAYVQCALLHTSSSGERRIRCAGVLMYHNSKINQIAVANVASQLAADVV